MHGANAFISSIQVDNYDETEKKIIAAGGMNIVPKFEVPGTCYSGYFLDTEGNIFGLFEVHENMKDMA